MFLKKNKSQLNNNKITKFSFWVFQWDKKLKIYLLSAIFCGLLFGFSIGQVEAATNTGTITSAVKDMSVPVNFGAVTWTEELPTGTSIDMDLRSGHNTDPNTWVNSGWTRVYKGVEIGSPIDGQRYVQYRATLSSADGNINNVPSIDNIEISVYKGELISSPFNTKNVSSVLNAIGWTEDKPGSSSVLFQVRTSPDNVTWSSWCGPDNASSGCNSGAYFTDPVLGGQITDADFKDSVGDKWMQYKVLLVGDLIDASTPILSNVNLSYDAPVHSGSLTSEIKNTGQQSKFGNLAWTDNTATLNSANAHADAEVTMKIRAGNTNDGSFTGWTDWISVDQGGSLDAFSGNQYIQYEATLSTFDDSLLPVVTDVTMPYVHYTLGAHKIISSAYDARNYANLLANIKWTENVPAGTNVKFQMRTAPNIDAGVVGESSDDVPDWANGSGWCGPGDSLDPENAPVNCAVTKDIADFATLSYETNPTIETANDVHMSGNNDQWMQYVVWLETENTFNTPILADATLNYTVNAPPEVSTTSSIQEGDGKVMMVFEVRDPDTSDGYTTDTVLGGFQYCKETDLALVAINCPDFGVGTKWENANTLIFKDSNGEEVLDEDNVASNILNVEEVNYTAYSVTWTPKTDYEGIYNSNLKVRVTANDSAIANAIGYGNDSIELDTKDPLLKTLNPLTIDRVINRAAETDNARLTIEDNDEIAGHAIENTDFDIFIKTVKASQSCPELAEPDKYQLDMFPANTPFTEEGDPKAFNISIPYTTTNYVAERVCLKIVDSKGNTTTKEIITPVPPEGVKFYDFSTIDNTTIANSIFKELIVWDESTNSNFGKYEVYRASLPKDGAEGVEANPDKVPDPGEFQKLQHPDATITNPANQYFFDTFTDITDEQERENKLYGLDQYFFYKIVVSDLNGNVSSLSSARVADIPNGQGGTDTKAPDLTISQGTTDVSWAEINISTDEIASAQVFYADTSIFTTPFTKSEDFTDSNSKNIADPSYVETHKVVINGLKKQTPYVVLVKVKDPSNNITEKIINLVTNDGPQIDNVTFERNSNTEATIFWTTDSDDTEVGGSSSKVSYSPTKSTDGTALSNPLIEEDPDITKTHRVTIKNLTPGIRYYFDVSSTRGSQTATDNNGGIFYNILTTVDSDAPIISNISTPLINSDTAAIQWLTDPQPSVGKVLYKKKTGESSFTSTEESFTYDSSHYVIISNLESNTEYIFKIYARNINGNENTSEEFEFLTEKDASFNHLPLAKIESINVPETNRSDVSAVVTFTTVDEVGEQIPAACKIDAVSIKDGKSTVVTSQESGWEGEKNYNTTHAMTLSPLDILTEYNFTISCHDNIIKDESKTNIEEKYEVISGVGSFTTKEEQGGAGDFSSDSTAPVINNVKVASTTGESATITWDTGEDSNSVVRYGTDDTYGNTAGNDLVNADRANFTTSHTVTVNGLIPATKYLFRASSTDAYGNIGQSSESSFTTASPSSLSSIKAESRNLGEAQITWNTSSDTTSTVEYGLTTSYEEKKESAVLTKEHSIFLSNLNQGVTYHFRVKGKDKDGKLYSSSDQTFEPKSPPQVSDISINGITEHEATISFNTNVPSSATVIYTNIQDPADNGSQADKEMATNHSIQIKNLTQGSTFKIQIQARDEQGTESQVDAEDLTTGKDENPPKIEQVRTEAALTQSDKVQAIINWKTDENSNTAILYKEGKAGKMNEIKVSDVKTTSHIAVITTFKAGTVYYFRVKSIDESGNEAQSSEYAILTPKKKENIIQIIVNNFQDIFGWARM